MATTNNKGGKKSTAKAKAPAKKAAPAKKSYMEKTQWAADKIKKGSEVAAKANERKPGEKAYITSTNRFNGITPKGGVVTKDGITEYSNGRAYRHSDGAKGKIIHSPSTGIYKTDKKNRPTGYENLETPKYQWDSYDASRVKPVKKATPKKKK